MKKLLFLISIIVFSCYNEDIRKEDNVELKKLFEEDQADRENRFNMNWDLVSKKDSLRRERVHELLDSNMIQTATDYSNAAMIFQHGLDTIASRMSIKMIKKAIELDSSTNKRLLAIAIDRDLKRRGKPQIYGTQYVKNNGGYWHLYEMDTSMISDQERMNYNVESLKEQHRKVVSLNNEDLLHQLFYTKK